MLRFFCTLTRANGEYFLDGSGGHIGSDPRARRCGWSIATIQEAPGRSCLGSICGSLVGPKELQTVPRVETMALLAILAFLQPYDTPMHQHYLSVLERGPDLQLTNWPPGVHTVAWRKSITLIKEVPTKHSRPSKRPWMPLKPTSLKRSCVPYILISSGLLKLLIRARPPLKMKGPMQTCGS